MLSLWILAAILFGIAELLTVGLITFWFCVGALLAAMAAGIGLPEGVQVGIFLCSSLILIALTRPIANKMFNEKIERTNSDALIGELGVVEKEITPFDYGRVKIQGKDWAAICENQELIIKEKQTVKIKDIDGVKLVVEPVHNNN